MGSQGVGYNRVTFTSTLGPLDLPGGLMVKNAPAMPVWSLGQEDPLEKEMTTHFTILAWEILWTEDLVGLQFMRLQSQT